MLFTQSLQTVDCPTYMPFQSTNGVRQVLFVILSIEKLPSDGSVGGFLFSFVNFNANSRWITNRSRKLLSSSCSNSMSAVKSHITPAFSFGHHEGFMSCHIVIRLVFCGPSHEPHPILTHHSGFGWQLIPPRSSPNCNCFDGFIPISRTGELWIIGYLNGLLDEWVIGYSGTPPKYLNNFSFPIVTYSFGLL